MNNDDLKDVLKEINYKKDEKYDSLYLYPHIKYKSTIFKNNYGDYLK